MSEQIVGTLLWIFAWLGLAGLAVGFALLTIEAWRRPPR